MALLESKPQEWLDAQRKRLEELFSTMETATSPEQYESAREIARALVESHPAYLQMACGWQVRTFHWDALNRALLCPQELWLAPRGSGKSTSDAVVFSAWLAIADPARHHREIRALNDWRGLFPDAPRRIGPWNIRIALTSNSAPTAERLHFQVKAILTGRRVRLLFGELAGRRWREDASETTLRERGRDLENRELELARAQRGDEPFDAREWVAPESREGTFTALGLGSKVTGGHYDFVVVDDWVTLDNARTEGLREKLEAFWAFTVRGTLEPWARTLGCGTRYHPADWYSTVLEWKKKGLWQSVHRTPALVVRGNPDASVNYAKPEELESYWPEVFSVARLLEIREEIGGIAFATQYQNETDLMLGDFFERKWLERFAKWEELSPRDRALARTVMAIDPAIKGGKRNDYTAFCVLSYVAPYFYVRAVRRGQWTEQEFYAQFDAMLREYKPGVVGFEIITGLEWVADKLRHRCGGASFKRLLPQQFRGGDKEGRASHVRGYLELDRVFFEEPTTQNGVGRLLDEMMAFPNAKGAGVDDCVDAFVWAMLLLGRSQTRLRRMQG
jgi:phage terminase large subunit-like protein